MNLSIKRKLALWYTTFFAILIVLNLFMVYVFAGPLLNVNAQNEIIRITEDMVDRIQLIEGTLFYVDSDQQLFNYYEDGVSYVLYRENVLYEGQYPSSIERTIPVQPYIIQRYSLGNSLWYIYDVPLQEGFILRAFYSYINVTEAYFRLVSLLLYAAPVLLIIAATGGFFIIKHTFKPIETITNTAKMIYDEGNYNVRFKKATTKDELFELTQVLNDLMQKTNEMMSREKQFSANVSHELRTPITVLKAQTEYLMSEVKDSSQYEEFKEMLKQINTLEFIVKQTLELTRTKTLAQHAAEMFSVKDVMDELILHLQSNIEALDLIVQTKIRLEDDMIFTNQPLFKIVLNNLLSNAIKYNKPTGIIDIEILENQKAYEVIVRDTGIGMKEDIIDKITRPYYRADNARSTRDVSLGLGLSIVSDAMNALKGTLTVQSTPEEGSVFTVQFPKVRP